jgi:hypothetical protein
MSSFTFPYSGSNAIIAADRVTAIANKDGVFLFGTETVCLSSKKTVNIEAKEKVIISAPIIELGNKAKDHGEAVILGDSLVRQLELLVDELSNFMTSASTVSYTDLNTLLTGIAIPANAVKLNLEGVKNAITNTLKSKKVFIHKN